MNVNDYIRRFSTLKSNRMNWETNWEQVAKYCLPIKEDITYDRAKGQRLPTDIYDTTGITSSQMLAAGLHGYLTSPASQ